MAQAACEVDWLLHLLEEFGVKQLKPVPLFCDNQAVVYLTSNSTFHERAKHMEIDCHFIRERYLKGTIKPFHSKGELQLVDIFTKALSSLVFHIILTKIGFHSIFNPHLGGSKISIYVGLK